MNHKHVKDFSLSHTNTTPFATLFLEEHFDRCENITKTSIRKILLCDVKLETNVTSYVIE